MNNNNNNNKENSIMKLTVKDCCEKISYKAIIDTESPTIIEFANFCHAAARALGFSDIVVDKYLPYYWDDKK